MDLKNIHIKKKNIRNIITVNYNLLHVMSSNKKLEYRKKVIRVQEEK